MERHGFTLRDDLEPANKMDLSPERCGIMEW